MTEKLDLKKTYKNLYEPSPKAPALVDVPTFNFICLDGSGDPNNNPFYQEVVTTLFSLSYALKFAVKKTQGIDYAVMPLEGLWWVEDMSRFSLERKGDWLWTMMILQPEWVTPDLFARMQPEVAKKKGLPQAAQARLESYPEGLSVQIMHLGPYSAESPTVARLHAFAHEQGYRLEGRHHEIYLGDVRKTAPEKLKTVIRQPVRK